MGGTLGLLLPLLLLQGPGRGSPLPVVQMRGLVFKQHRWLPLRLPRRWGSRGLQLAIGLLMWLLLGMLGVLC